MVPVVQEDQEVLVDLQSLQYQVNLAIQEVLEGLGDLEDQGDQVDQVGHKDLRNLVDLVNLEV